MQKTMRICYNFTGDFMYYTYILRCCDNTLYTGIASDIEKRMNEHFLQNEKCAKYTRTHKAKKLESLWISENRATASKLEYHIKHLTKKQKEEIIALKSLDVLKDKVPIEIKFRKLSKKSDRRSRAFIFYQLYILILKLPFFQFHCR